MDVERARALKDADPAVQAGRFDVIVMPWMVPAGAMSFAPAHFPRSMAEVEDVEVELTWDPPWSPEKMSDDAKFILGFG